MEIKQDLVKPNGYITSLTLCSIWFLIIGSITFSLKYNNIIVYLSCVIILGIAQRYLEELSHQALHKNLFSHPKLNDKLDFFYAIPLFYTIKGEREEHYLHHSHLKEQQAKKNYSYDHLGIFDLGVNYKPYRFFVLFIQPFLGTQGLIELKNILFNIKKYFYKCYVYHLLVVIVLFYFHLENVYLYYWLIPFFTVFCFLYYYSELFTHFGCRKAHLSRDTANWLTDYFIAPLGFCRYHSLHHLTPKIPWFRCHKVNDNYEKNRQSLRQTFKDMLNAGEF